MSANRPTGPIHVWDRFVRIFHWSLVACVLADYFLVDDGEMFHQVIGYAACALVAARIVWGFVGSTHARFVDFFPTPARVRRHVSAMISGRGEFHPGHNPLGALMMLTLITLVVALGVTGSMQTLDAFWGEEWLQDLHATLGSVLIACAGLHATAAILMSRIEHTNLVGAMISGVKVYPRRDADG